MARVHITIPDEERERFVHQAQSEGLSLSAWLRLAARGRLRERKRIPAFNSPEELQAFFDSCDTLEGPESEPEWEEHLATINESRIKGVALVSATGSPGPLSPRKLPQTRH